VPAGPKSSIAWTVDDDAAIVRMRTDNTSFTKIASKLGNGHHKQVESSPERQTAVNVIFR
jgi:hypothetical protein